MLKSEHGLLGIVDIVLNHTANNSKWIQSHPEACYNTDSVPALWPAWLIDNALAEMSVEFAKGNVKWCGSAPFIRNEHDLTQVCEEARRRISKL